jgi:hypothetical protein
MSDSSLALPIDTAPPEKNNLQNGQHEVAASPSPDSANSDHGPSSSQTETPAASKFLRGPLKYDVDTSSAQLEAGKAFSVFVRVTNPYESAVSLLDVSASLPTEFRDKDDQEAGLFRTLKDHFKEELKGRIVVAQNVIATNNNQPSHEVSPAGEVLLQHGNSSLKRFTLKTWHSTLFMPAAYRLQFQVQYKIDGVLNLDTIRQEFNIRAPLGAVLRGAFWGSIVGSVLHSLYALQATSKQATWSDFLVQTVSGILLGGVLVVAFVRKKDAQPFISIEDFYGGFFVGFSAGYIGKALLSKVLPIS